MHRIRLSGLGVVVLATAAAVFLAASPASAQLAEKPSAYVAKRQGRLPQGTTHADPHLASLQRVADRADFDRIARVYGSGSEREIVHSLVVIDRARGDRIDYVNTARYALHEDFVRARYLSGDSDRKALRASYSDPKRRFIFATIGWRRESGRWMFEYWEGDRLTPEILALTAQRIAATFYTPVVFKANSAQQEEVARASGSALVTEAEILGQRAYLPLNTGRAVGRLRLVADIEGEDEDDIEPNDIVVLRDVPLALPPVAGVVTEQPSTVLSHVNLLAKGWGIPNAYLRDAFTSLRPLDRQWVALQVGDDGWSIEPTAQPERLPSRPRASAVRAPELKTEALLPLARLGAAMQASCGGKASTLGEVEQGRRSGRIAGIAPVPDGFCIPFAHYARFMQRPEVRSRVAAALASEGFARSRVTRRKALEALRRDLLAMPIDADESAAWVSAWQGQLGGRGVFVRSSSNAEDLANFSGAGLFSTVPNVTRAERLGAAVVEVWASVYNFEAYEARRQAGIGDDEVVMGVFVQVAVDSQTSGVLITRDPFDRSHGSAVYVSAKRGIGIKVVEGRRVAEQSMVDSRSGAVRRLTRSAEDSALVLDAGGGVVESAIAADHEVLADATVRRLAAAGRAVKALLGRGEQDIEWAVDPQGRVVILQARPFIERNML